MLSTVRVLCAQIARNVRSYEKMSVEIRPADADEPVDPRIAPWMKTELVRGDLTAKELLAHEHAQSELQWALRMACKVHGQAARNLLAHIRYENSEVLASI